MNTALIQTRALFIDAYRELSSKKLFWLALFISLLVVAALACLGVNAKGITVLWWDFEHPIFNSKLISPGQYYKFVFAEFGVPIWLGWGATILALVSTGGLFPDFIASGSIELMLAKPISRLRLFLTKYLAGLLFTALQVGVFTTACFLVFGIRGNAWEPSIFWTIPLVVLFYSYLFSICVLFGILTKSTITSILLTMLLWFFFFLLNSADGFIMMLKVNNQINQEQTIVKIERQVKGARDTWVKVNTTDDGTAPAREPTPEEIEKVSSILPSTRKDLEEAQKNAVNIKTAERIVVTAKTILPKTSETITYLKRKLGPLVPENQLGSDEMPEGGAFGRPMSRKQQAEFERRIEEELKGRTTLWVLGTSIVFEIAVLLLAARIFTRRDY
jgi:ABC-type transport system involved in multi-copper enzyme maturation permease subunit